MTTRQDIHYLRGLLRELRSNQEAEWVEFKVDNTKPDLVGEYISALANSAALVGKAHGYMVWGVDDETHAAPALRHPSGDIGFGGEHGVALHPRSRG